MSRPGLMSRHSCPTINQPTPVAIHEAPSKDTVSTWRTGPSLFIHGGTEKRRGSTMGMERTPLPAGNQTPGRNPRARRSQSRRRRETGAPVNDWQRAWGRNAAARPGAVAGGTQSWKVAQGRHGTRGTRAELAAAGDD